jgi:salicylate hydroxylase
LVEPNVSSKLWHCSEDNKDIVETVFDTRLTFGAPSIFCRRSRLQAELYRLATDASLPGKPARVLTNVNLKSIDPNAGVVVADTGETYVCDLIIAADGINSAVRGILSQLSKPIGSGPVIGISEDTAAALTGVAAYMSVVPAEVIASDPDLAFQTAKGLAGFGHWKAPDPSKLRVFCYPRDCTKYFQVLAFVPETEWTEEFERNKTSIIKGVPTEKILKHFEKFHPSVKKLIRYASVEVI